MGGGGGGALMGIVTIETDRDIRLCYSKNTLIGFKDIIHSFPYLAEPNNH